MSRIDKYIWAVRVFKTRSLASEECRKGHVLIDGKTVKPSRIVKINDVIDIKKNKIVYKFKVIELIENRIAAKLVPNYAEDITPQSELDKLKTDKYAEFFTRDPGTGRPTKKERREIDKLFEDTDDQYDNED